MKLVTNTGEHTITFASSRLGQGGEGYVSEVVSHDSPELPPAQHLVVKIYHSPSKEQEKKVLAMLRHQPRTNAIAWVQGVVYDNGSFIGYVMQKLDSDNYRQWLELSNTRSRKRVAKDFHFLYALTACYNLTIAVKSAHEAHAILGDINESNVFVQANSNVLIIDSDSAQITTDKNVFPCLVGKPEYTAPEISHGSFKDNLRTPETDVFALAVMIFQMVSGGAHVTDGSFLGDGTPPSVTEKIQQGIYPALGVSSSLFTAVERIPTEALPQRLLLLLVAMTEMNPADRPSLDVVISELDAMKKELVQCGSQREHWFSQEFAVCPWCARVQKGLNDIWAENSEMSQQALSPISFSQNGGSAPVVRRKKLSSNAPQQPSHSGQQHSQVPLSSQGTSSLAHTTPPPVHVSHTTVPEPQIPDKIDGKTVVIYADGSYGKRPPISQLLKANPKLACSSMRNETPDFAQFWWSTKKPLIYPYMVPVGIMLSVCVAYLWYLVLPLTLTYLPSYDIVPVIVRYVSLVAGLSTIFFTSFFMISSLVDYRRATKKAPAHNYKRDKQYITILRCLGISVIYGLPFMFALIFFLIFLAVSGEKK